VTVVVLQTKDVCLHTCVSCVQPSLTCPEHIWSCHSHSPIIFACIWTCYTSLV